MDSWHHQKKKGTRAYAVQVGDTVWRRRSHQIRVSAMAPAPAPDTVASEQVVHEPRETEGDVFAMFTPSIVMDQPVKRSTQTVTPHKVVAETVRRSKGLIKLPDKLTL